MAVPTVIEESRLLVARRAVATVAGLGVAFFTVGTSRSLVANRNRSIDTAEMVVVGRVTRQWRSATTCRMDRRSATVVQH